MHFVDREIIFLSVHITYTYTWTMPPLDCIRILQEHLKSKSRGDHYMASACNLSGLIQIRTVHVSWRENAENDYTYIYIFSFYGCALILTREKYDRVELTIAVELALGVSVNMTIFY